MTGYIQTDVHLSTSMAEHWESVKHVFMESLVEKLAYDMTP